MRFLVGKALVDISIVIGVVSDVITAYPFLSRYCAASCRLTDRADAASVGYSPFRHDHGSAPWRVTVVTWLLLPSKRRRPGLPATSSVARASDRGAPSVAVPAPTRKTEAAGRRDSPHRVREGSRLLSAQTPAGRVTRVGQAHRPGI